MIAELLLGAQIILLIYFSFFGFYLYLYSFASLKKVVPRKVKLSGSKVAVVIVAFNEPEVIESTVKACEKLTYKNKTIIVADDSNDKKTYEILKRMAKERKCKRLRKETFVNHDITHVHESDDFVVFHRTTNVGFKAGSLKELESYLKAKGFEYMYLLDAEWWPQKDTLERCLEVIEADDKLAYVQTVRQNYHGKMSLFQRCLALNEDGCYYVDLRGRQALGDPILFTGCCTMFNLTHLMYVVDGFQPGHLTEDIDLTNRFYTEGFKAAFLPDVINKGEVPPHYRAFRKQQERWTMGSARTLKEYFWPIIHSDVLTWREKISLMRQNSYFTPAIGIECSIILAFFSILLLSAHSDYFQSVQYMYYLQTIAPWFNAFLLVALCSNFIPPLMTASRQRSHLNFFFIPQATWISWSLLHTYFLANLKGLFGIKQGWFKTPKTNRKKSKKGQAMSTRARLASLATLMLLLWVYVAEWQHLGWVDIYAFFWVPALTLSFMAS